ncbi:hypothetical protein AMTRI_Chr08g207410 [Amborella trichopoda]
MDHPRNQAKVDPEIHTASSSTSSRGNGVLPSVSWLFLARPCWPSKSVAPLKIEVFISSPIPSVWMHIRRRLSPFRVDRSVVRVFTFLLWYDSRASISIRLCISLSYLARFQ